MPGSRWAGYGARRRRATLNAAPCRLTADGLALVGEPAALITSGAEWERPLIENPAMVVAAQSFVLL